MREAIREGFPPAVVEELMRASGLTLKELASALDLSHQPVTNAIVAAYISRSMLETRILKNWTYKQLASNMCDCGSLKHTDHCLRETLSGRLALRSVDCR